MADIARRGSRPQFVVPVTFALVFLLAAACSTPAVSPPSPSPAPTPVPSVDPHLGDQASAKAVFNGLSHEGLKFVTNTAEVGAAGTAVITRINATYGGWPLQLVEYRTAADLKKAAAWKAGQAPGKGEPPVALAGANILIRWGPWDLDTKPPRPDERQTAALEALVAAMGRLLAPLRTRSNVPVQTVSAPVAAEDGPSAAPEATPAP
jgi:hypothetical protein